MVTRDAALAQLTGLGGQFELAKVEEARGPLRVFVSGPGTLRDVLIASRAHGEREFLIHDDERITYAEHFRRVARLAHWLRAQGIGKGDRVGICMRNYPEWSITFFACQAIGAIAVTLNAWWTGRELVYGITDSGKPRGGGRRRALQPPPARARRTSGCDPAGHSRSVRRWRCAVGRGARGALRRRRASRGRGRAAGLRDDPLHVGHHGLPERRAARAPQPCHQHSEHAARRRRGPSAVACCARSRRARCRVRSRGHRRAWRRSGTSAATVRPAVLPVLPHRRPERAVHHAPERRPARAHVQVGRRAGHRPHRARAGDVVERGAHAGAGTCRASTRARRRAGFADGNFLGWRARARRSDRAHRCAVQRPGSARQRLRRDRNDVGHRQQWRRRLPRPAAQRRAGRHYGRRPGGRRFGRRLPAGSDRRTVGARSQLFAGYWNKPRETAEAFSDGWFKTGDLAYVDEGFHYVVDRKKDVIIRGGENVYCAEVEQVLHEHPDIVDVAVIGLPHRALGEEVAVVVERRPGSTITADDVQNRVAARLARYNVPSRVFFTEERLPRTASGKILKRDLKQQYGG